MMHTYTIATLANLPISQDNNFVRIDKYGRDLSADYDIYILVGDHWIWAYYAWTPGKASWLAKQASYEKFTAARAIGADCDRFFAYGKEVIE